MRETTYAERLEIVIGTMTPSGCVYCVYCGGDGIPMRQHNLGSLNDRCDGCAQPLVQS